MRFPIFALLPMAGAVLTTSTFYSCDTIVPKASVPAVAQISDGQAQAPTATAATQISDGQIQAPSATAVVQISDGQVQASSAVAQISDGQIQASQAAAPVTQIDDGQIQASPIAQISDGQIQASSAEGTLTVQLTEYQTSRPTSTVVAAIASNVTTASVSASLVPFMGEAVNSHVVAVWTVIGAGLVSVFGAMICF